MLRRIYYTLSNPSGEVIAGLLASSVIMTSLEAYHSAWLLSCRFRLAVIKCDVIRDL